MRTEQLIKVTQEEAEKLRKEEVLGWLLYSHLNLISPFFFYNCPYEVTSKWKTYKTVLGAASVIGRVRLEIESFVCWRKYHQ